jgi:hypothetical protein
MHSRGRSNPTSTMQKSAYTNSLLQQKNLPLILHEKRREDGGNNKKILTFQSAVQNIKGSTRP